MEIYDDDLLISGPYNVVRIENKELNKVLYLFSDYHMSPKYQTKCDDPKSIHISQFLDKIFRKTKIPLDFFLEIAPMNKDKDEYIYRYKWFDDLHLIKLRTDFSKKYENVRKHFIDIRYVTFDVFDIRDRIHELLKFTKPPTYRQYNDIKNKLNNILKEHELINAIIFEDENAIKNIVGEKAKKMLKNFIKIHKYTKQTENDEKFKILYDEIKRYMTINKKNINALINEINDLENEYNNDSKILLGIDGKYHMGDYNKIVKIKNKIMETMNNFFINFVDSEVFIMDLYFLRRFLEKKYINNAIVYAGGAHISNYILFLVTQYNFKITNIFYNGMKTIDNLENKIIEMYKSEKKMYGYPDSANEILINILERKIFSQCINLKGFPKKFR